jgi:hypothetical protein
MRDAGAAVRKSLGFGFSHPIVVTPSMSTELLLTDRRSLAPRHERIGVSLAQLLLRCQAIRELFKNQVSLDRANPSDQNYKQPFHIKCHQR